MRAKGKKAPGIVCGGACHDNRARCQLRLGILAVSARTVTALSILCAHTGKRNPKPCSTLEAACFGAINPERGVGKLCAALGRAVYTQALERKVLCCLVKENGSPPSKMAFCTVIAFGSLEGVCSRHGDFLCWSTRNLPHLPTYGEATSSVSSLLLCGSRCHFDHEGFGKASTECHPLLNQGHHMIRDWARTNPPFHCGPPNSHGVTRHAAGGKTRASRGASARCERKFPCLAGPDNVEEDPQWHTGTPARQPHCVACRHARLNYQPRTVNATPRIPCGCTEQSEQQPSKNCPL